MVIRVKLSTLAWTILTLPLFPLTLVPWLSGKADNDGRYVPIVLLAIAATAAVATIYIMSVVNTSTITEVASPLGISVEDGIKYEVTVAHHTVIPFLPWSWSYQKSYVRWEAPHDNNYDHDHAYWIDVETGESFLSNSLEKEFENFMTKNLHPEQVKLILAD